MILRTYGDSVIHSGDAWCQPGGSFRLLPFRPGSHGTSEHHLAAVRFDRLASTRALRRNASSILCLISTGDGAACGLSRIKLLTPLTPSIQRIALSA